jgi:quinol monooxygenase YgiN/ketosteroid isomerase-like protein
MITVLLAAAATAANTCDSNTHECNSKSGGTPPLTGFSVFHASAADHKAFKQDLRTLVSGSRAHDGAVSYEMYENPTQPGAIGFVEQWRDAAALRAHLTSPLVRGVFDNEYYKTIKVSDAQLFGPWTPVSAEPDAQEELELVFYWTMDCPKKHVWDIITDWTSAAWVLGSPKTELVPVPKEVCVDQRVQRRTFGAGDHARHIDVCMISKDDATFTTVQETVNGLVFPTVEYDKFFVTLSLDSHGVDPDTQSRMRYHTRATMKRGTFAQGRSTLKDDFYGPRIAFYQRYFNCTGPTQYKRAQASIEKLHAALATVRTAPNAVNATTLADAAAPFFATTALRDQFVAATPIVANARSVDVKLAQPLVTLPDLRVIAVEDVISTSTLEARTHSRIAIYQLDALGAVVSWRVFDELAALHASSPVVRAIDNYFDVITKGDIEKVRPLYAADAVLEDPTGFMPPRTFDSVYTNFYTVARSFVYKRSPRRTYVLGRQVAQVVDAEFVLAANGKTLRSAPVQVFTLDDSLKITHFEAFFKPSVIDFSKLH